jgi:acyl dehydratase
MSDFKQGDSLPELRVTPDAGLTKRYAEASGDPNPIHTDPEFAKSVGLPGVILHGLYSMAQVARAHTEAAAGDPRALKRLSDHRQGGERRPPGHRYGRRSGRQPDHPQRRGGAGAGRGSLGGRACRAAGPIEARA